jgi:hypothetical protein
MANRNRRKKNGNGITVTSLPVAKNYAVPSSTPIVSTRGSRTNIRNHELIGTVFGSTQFKSQRIPINPGLGHFPWLSNIAESWDKYRWNKIRVEYIPSNAVVTTPGSVHMAVDYDASDAPPDSLADQSAYQTIANGRVYARISLTPSMAEMNSVTPEKLIRPGPVHADLTLYDAFMLIISTINCLSDDPIGQLWVFYDVDLYSPSVGQRSQHGTTTSVYNISTDQNFTSGISAPLGYNQELLNGLQVEEEGVIPGRFILQPGTYDVRASTVWRNTQPNVTAADALTQMEVFVNGAPMQPRQFVQQIQELGTSGSSDQWEEKGMFCIVIDLADSVLEIIGTVTGTTQLITAVKDMGRIFIQAIS